MRVSQEQRIAGGLIGLLVGDALGVPYEFHPASALPPSSLIEMQPPSGFRRAHVGVRPGTWSDDGAQALVLLESLLRNRRFVLADFASGLLRWHDQGYLAVDGNVFDVGMQTARALDKLRRGIRPEDCGGADERDNGNGSLMRVLPLALWYRGSSFDVAWAALRQSLPTHAHPRSLIACIQLCLWARELYARHDVEEAWDVAASMLSEIGAAFGLPAEEVALVLDPPNMLNVAGTGYVVDTLWSARACLVQSGSYEEVVRAAIGLGNDTDTTAAVAGGLAGLLYGVERIPLRWRNALRGEVLLAPLLDGLMARWEQTPRLHRSVPRTSETHPLQISWRTMGSGRIGISECPGLQLTCSRGQGMERYERSLEMDLSNLVQQGVGTVVTLLEPDEIIDHGIDGLRSSCEAHGVHWLHLPLSADRGTDTYFEQDLAHLLPTLREALDSGQGVLLHANDWNGRICVALEQVLSKLCPELSQLRVKRIAAVMVGRGIAATAALDEDQ